MRTQISDEKIKEILIDGINKGAKYILNKAKFYEFVRQENKIMLDRCNKLYDLYYPEAQAKRNEVKLMQGVSSEIENTNENIITKNQALEILSQIAQGKERKIKTDAGEEIIIPTPSEQTKAINQMSAMCAGWQTPKQTEDVTKYKKLTLKEINDRLKDYGINEEE